MHSFRSVEENLRFAMSCYSRVSALGETREFPGVAVTSSGVNIAVFNSALLTAPASPRELNRAIETSSEYFGEKRLGWSFWLCEDLLAPEFGPPPRSTFQRRGLRLVARPPGMYSEQVHAATRPAAGLEYRPIDDERTRLDFAHISSAVFALPFASARRIYCEAALWQPPMKGWIGYINNKAVSIVTTVIAADAIGVYSLGTLPQYQGRGYGETLFRHAVAEAGKETGITRSILQSTEDGLNLYMRMGYRVVMSFSVYTKETCGRD